MKIIFPTSACISGGKISKNFHLKYHVRANVDESERSMYDNGILIKK